MAVQVRLEELEGCKSYFAWLIEHLEPIGEDHVDFNSEISRELCRLMYEADFYWKGTDKDGAEWEIAADEIRAKDALEIRKRYAEEAGKSAGKSDRDIDRIWKSIYGKASVLEVIFSLCEHLDAMVNEDEPGCMVGLFFRSLISNLGLDDFDDEDFDHREKEVKSVWEGRIKLFLNREYFESGCCGGLFPLQNWHKETDKDQRKISLWDQMGTWLNEHLDDEGLFVVEKTEKNG